MMHRIWQWLRPRSNEDFANEVESHLAMETDRLMATGMSEHEARQRARRAFGNATSVREQFRDTRWPRLEPLAQDIRYGLRGMRRHRGFTAIAVMSLAVGIGANTTMFGTLDALLLRGPAHVVDANRINRLYFESPRPGETSIPFPTQGYRTYEAIRENTHSFETVAAFWANKVTSGRGSDARLLEFVAVTSSFFPMLGVRPAIGRFFAEDEQSDETRHVAVIGAELWRSAYGGDRSVLGRAIDINGMPYTVIGVAPDDFTGVNLDRVEIWLPLGVARRLLAANVLERHSGAFWLEILGKRREGLSPNQAAADVTAAYRGEWRDSPRYQERYENARAISVPLQLGRGPADNLTSRVSIWIAAVSLLVLVLASINVSNLLLLRSLSRSQEVAVRVSLGASRSRLMQQWLVEGALLSVAAGTCALITARWSATTVHAFLLPKVSPKSVLDARLLVFTALVSLGAGLVASLLPALVTVYRDSARTLGTGRRGGPQRVVIQRILIGTQVALAMVLLVGAGLFVKSFREIRAIDLGIDVDHVLFVNVDFGSMQKLWRDRNARASANAIYREMLGQVKRVPGVRRASMSAGSTFGASSAIALYRPGIPPRQGMAVPFFRAVAPDFFETTGTPLIRGRFFNADDHRANSGVLIVDETTAKEFLPGGDVLQGCVVAGSDQCAHVVGIVKDAVMWDMIGQKGRIVYGPVEDSDEPITTLEIRTAGDPSELIPAIRRAIQSVSPDLPWVDVHPVSQDLDPQLRPRRISAAMFTTFGILALGLAAIGLYGLLAYAVAQQSHEIGVRKALGATDGRITRMVLRSALGVTIGGVAIGLLASLATSKIVANQLYGVSARDPVILSISAVSLIAVSIIAALAPVRRATRVDPVVTLRAD